jgi:hypothetical protein
MNFVRRVVDVPTPLALQHPHSLVFPVRSVPAPANSTDVRRGQGLGHSGEICRLCVCDPSASEGSPGHEWGHECADCGVAESVKRRSLLSCFLVPSPILPRTMSKKEIV